MSANEENIINLLVEAMQAQKKPEAYDTGATITRIEKGTAWVHIPGGVDETPVKLTIDAKVGDEVQVRVSDGQAFLVGNATAPPTDDKVAIDAEASAKKALAANAETQKYFWHDTDGTHVATTKDKANRIDLKSGENVIATFTPAEVKIGGSRFDPELGYTFDTNPPLSIFNTLTLSVSSGILSSLIHDASGMLLIKADDGTNLAAIDLNLGVVNLQGTDLQWNGDSILPAVLTTYKQVISSSTSISSGSATSTLTVACDAIAGYTPIFVSPRNSGHNAAHFRLLYLDGTDIKVQIGNASASSITVSSAYVNVMYVRSAVVGQQSQTLTVSQDPNTGTLTIS